MSTHEPQPITKLVKLVQREFSLSEQDVFIILHNLERDTSLSCNKNLSLPAFPQTLKNYCFSKYCGWYWSILFIVGSTLTAIFTIHDSLYPLTYIRQIFGIIFVLFIPGFSFMRLIYPKKVTLLGSVRGSTSLECLALSLGLSVTLTAIVGLVLNFTPWGITLLPTASILFIITLVFSTIAVVQDYNRMKKEKFL